MRGYTPEEEARYLEDLQRAARFFEVDRQMLEWKYRSLRQQLFMRSIGDMIETLRREQRRNALLLLCR